MIKISHQKDQYSSQVVIPAFFFYKYMPLLDDPSLRLYLYLNTLVQDDFREINTSNLALQLGMNEHQLADSLEVLAKHQLILWTEEGLEIADLSFTNMSESLKPAQANKAEMSDSTKVSSPPETSSKISAREAVIRQINDTFYQGTMPLIFYRKIERWFQEYGFEAEVIYALFNELRRYETLHSDSYAESIANNWFNRGIRTFSDLSDYHEARNGINKYALQVQKNLRQSQALSTYQMDFLQRWMEDWKLPFELVDEAFRRAASKNNHNNFNYVEAILKNWYEAGVKTSQDIIDYESAHREKSKLKYDLGERKNLGRSGRNVGNFDQRTYSEDSFQNLDRSLDFLDNDR